MHSRFIRFNPPPVSFIATVLMKTVPNVWKGAHLLISSFWQVSASARENALPIRTCRSVPVESALKIKKCFHQSTAFEQSVIRPLLVESVVLTGVVPKRCSRRIVPRRESQYRRLLRRLTESWFRSSVQSLFLLARQPAGRIWWRVVRATFSHAYSINSLSSGASVGLEKSMR